jgi:flagellar basal-body rod modification protein FlgD
MSTGTSTINAANSLTTAASSSQAGLDKSRKTIADNFDAFLNLLTTQLRNQSPLDPLDANQFTQQLVQFSGVEQQLKTNDLLSSLAKGLGGGTSGANGGFNAASAASLIGKNVAVDGSSAKLTKTSLGHEARYPVRVQSNYSNYNVEIADSSGNVVFSGPWTPPGTGDQAYVWDGRNLNGATVDTTGTYSITVSGQNENGGISRMQTTRSGSVTSVDLSGSEPQVRFGDFLYPLSKITSVSAGS